MKRIILLSISLLFLSHLFSQNATNETLSPEDILSQPEPEIVFDDESSFKDVLLPSPQSRTKQNVLWTKTVWRMIDLREQFNFPMYYPINESNGRKSLFLTIFDLLKEGKVSAYEYIEEKEDFSDAYKLTFSKVLKETKIDIFDIEINDNGDSSYVINPIDIPGANVLKFYIKEIWYFDALESCMKFKLEAIAPQLYFTNLDGKEEKSVLFWVPFDQLRPELAKQPVVINNKNSMASISYDDLFQKRRFIGHIYKEDNIQNRTLLQYCNTPTEVRSEQTRIENEILNFEFDLWEF